MKANRLRGLEQTVKPKPTIAQIAYKFAGVALTLASVFVACGIVYIALVF